jgi:hypothetical protein
MESSKSEFSAMLRIGLGVPVAMAAAGLLGLNGCKKPAEPEPATNEIAQSAQAPVPPAVPAASAAPAPTERVSWAEPEVWRKVPSTSGMRKATYAVPKAAGDAEDGELAVFYFGPNMGGSIDANAERWIKQFSDVDPKQIKRDQRSANGLLQHTIEIPKGTYASGMPGAPATPKSGYALLGAIVETPVGNYFFKLTGPLKTVAGAREAFFKLLDSVKAT